MKQHFYATLVLLLLAASAGAQTPGSRAPQPSVARLPEAAQQGANRSLDLAVELNPRQPAQAALRFGAAGLHADNALGWLGTQLQLRPGQDQLRLAATTKAGPDVAVQKVEQYYQGIKVEHGGARIVARAGQVTSMQLEFYPVTGVASSASLSAAAALQKATAYIGARRYVWQGYTGPNPEFQRPRGELVIVEDMTRPQELRLAWKFDVYADEPLSRNYVYVDATSGRVVSTDAIIKHVNAAGGADSRYSGRVNITTDNTGAGYRLRETRNGHNITTLNYQRRTRSSTNDGLAGDFTDADNNWTSAEFNNATWDNAALDVQFGTELVSDYWRLVHDRSSWNNTGGEMKSYVHVNQNYDNAFWSGTAMYYGDGSFLGTGSSSGFKPLTALDVCAHELGHGICQATAALVYRRESGGLNEGFSDIWAACVENYSGLPKSPFLMGEEISAQAGGFLRSMQNPNAAGSPDTYEGSYWRTTTLAGCPVPNSNVNDNCGVHYNSGVLNKWFYLITQGETGVNDKGDAYSVSGLGFGKTQRIAYLTELSLTPNADYAATRAAALSAASTLYGACSNELQQVANAWFAVGVGGSANCQAAVEFTLGRSEASEAATAGSGCAATRPVAVGVKLGAPSPTATTVTLSLSGSATAGQDYSISPAALTFAAGQSGTQYATVTVTDDQLMESSETIVLGLTVAANGGTATAGANNQTHTLTITDNDLAPAPIVATPVGTETLLTENFDAVAALPTGWGQLTLSGDAGTNQWAVGPNGGAGVTGNAAYITTNTATKPFGYNNTRPSARVLAGPTLDVSNYTDLKLSFKYKVEGEYYTGPPNNTLDPFVYDYGRVGLIIGSQIYYLGPSASPYLYYGNGTAVVAVSGLDLSTLLGSATSCRVSFVWISDDLDGAGLPLLVDEVVVTGRRKGAMVATQLGQTTAVAAPAGAANQYLTSPDQQLLGRLSGLSQALSCLTATVAQAGTAQTGLSTPEGNFQRAQKVIQLTPGTPAPAATYSATLYFTAAELAGFANKSTLKILQADAGVNLAGVVRPGVARLITPTAVVEDATTGVVALTGQFTGFGQLAVVAGNTALPAELGPLTAAQRGPDALLRWDTYQERNNRGFEVERSPDGQRFEPVGFVVGRGTASQRSGYQFTDRGAATGQPLYYRLRQLDFDGTAAYSNVVHLRPAAAQGQLASVRPNPAHEQIQLTFFGEPAQATVTVFGTDGRQVLQRSFRQPGSGPVRLPVAQLPAGAYFVRVSDGRTVETHPLLKQ
jgi:Zn-dependent metalloprotease